MSGAPRERIIPIRLESDDSMDENDKDTSLEEPSTSKERIQTDDEDETFPETPLDSTDGSVNGTLTSVKRTIPMANVKEKILIVIDSAEDEKFTPFTLNNAPPNRSIDILKSSVETFLHHKNRIGDKHEYALAVLNENSVVWLCDFTSNISEAMGALEEVTACETEDIFELNSLFELISQKVEIPELVEMDGVIIPPPYTVRVLLLYGRSYTMPKIMETEEIETLLKAPFFTLDVLMTHEPVDNDNNCNKIFNVLQNLDRKGFAYFFSVGRDAKVLFSSMGKLLGHPLQRPVQPLTNYQIKV